ncbi:response regulator [bacterium]|nr:MAG: response regulator [bacterium]
MPNYERDPAKVLLFEDNPDDEQVALRVFRRQSLPLDVSVARDGEQALQSLGLTEGGRGPQEIPDLIVSDLKMPKLSGDEVLVRVRACERLRDVPYVMFTSSDNESDIERCMARGASAYCTKPVGFPEYVECLTKMVEKWLGPGDEPDPDCELESAGA